MHQHYQELTKNTANYIPLSPLSFLARTADIFGARTAIIYGDRPPNRVAADFALQSDQNVS